MGVVHYIFKLLSLLFLLGSAVCLVLTLIIGCGAKRLNKFYWLQTDCSRFSGSPIKGNCRWTSYNLCGTDKGGGNANCVSSQAAYPFSPRDNFSSTNGLPSSFIKSRNTYYYLSKIGWALLLVGLFFLLLSLIPFCSYVLGRRRGRRPFWIVYPIAFTLSIAGVAMMTAAYAKGRNALMAGGHPATLGSRALSTAWIGVGCLFLNFFIIPYLLKSRKYKADEVNDERESGWDDQQEPEKKQSRFARLFLTNNNNKDADADSMDTRTAERQSYLSHKAEQRGGARYMNKVDTNGSEGTFQVMGRSKMGA